MELFPHYAQMDAMDCGPTCLRMIAKYYGRNYTLQTLRSKSFLTREGVSMLGISDAAESIGFRTTGLRTTFDQLAEEKPFPCILHWNQDHFVVCYDMKKRRNGYEIKISDPASGRYKLKKEEFSQCWVSSKAKGKDTGTVLLLEPTPEFYGKEDEKYVSNKNFRYFASYLKPHKSHLVQLVIGMIAGSLLQLIFPFLTQAMVDNGIGNSNLSFITLILIAQLILFATQLAVEFIRSWILLHMNTRINIALISDFLAKLLKLPLRFFDTKMVGDIMQRIGDHARIESFLTGSSLATVFSFFNFIIFAFILAYYNFTILAIFIIGNAVYVLWILLFMKYRRELDYKRFAQASGEKSNLFQLISGIQEIKLNNCEKQERWKWEKIQIKLFKIGVRGLALRQYQQSGSVFFSQITTLLISFVAAKSVIDGNMTLGMMVSISYIIGQLSAPIGQIIGFIQSFQDAQISLERLNEIHGEEDEEQTIADKMDYISENKTISVENLCFSYDGADRDYVLKDVNLVIPDNKITAIVGASGSGKTTLIKLMMGFYEPNKGDIKVGGFSSKNINPHLWRQKSGVVMQDGFIFSETIARNIAVGDEDVDRKRLARAAEIANIKEYIDSLPLGYNTKIGMEGSGLSQGQKQRILIARAVYKNPDFIFLDEATNALDAKNERQIIDNLSEFYRGRTVVVVAHRLSTVQHADKIVVLDNGKIAEEGTHQELVNKKGTYYTLVKNQLELGM